MKLRPGLAFFVSVVLAWLVVPLPRGMAAPAVAAKHFADFAGFDVTKIIPPPPAAGSLAAQADVETVLQVQASRTPRQVAWAALIDPDDSWVLFSADNLLGPRFTEKNLPHLAALLKDYSDDLDPLNNVAKRTFARARPFLTDARVQPSVKRLGTGSYPSGHALFAYMDATVLAEIFPDKRAALFDRARSVAWSRVIGGAHFPTDLEAGHRLAEFLMAEEFKNPAFRAALAQCRQEAATVMTAIGTP